MRHRILILMSMLLVGTFSLAPACKAAPESDPYGENSLRGQTELARGESQRLKRQRIKGTVTRVTGQVAYIRTSPSRVVAVQLGPSSYWEYRGYRLVPGEAVTVWGWHDPYDDPELYFAGTVAAPGFSLTLTNDVGVPVWVTEDVYVSGWYPTHDVYYTWYRPTYRFVPPGHAKGAPPGHIKGASPGHMSKSRGEPRKSSKRIHGR